MHLWQTEGCQAGLFEPILCKTDLNVHLLLNLDSCFTLPYCTVHPCCPNMAAFKKITILYPRKHTIRLLIRYSYIYDNEYYALRWHQVEDGSHCINHTLFYDILKNCFRNKYSHVKGEQLLVVRTIWNMWATRFWMSSWLPLAVQGVAIKCMAITWWQPSLVKHHTGHVTWPLQMLRKAILIKTKSSGDDQLYVYRSACVLMTSANRRVSRVKIEK